MLVGKDCNYYNNVVLIRSPWSYPEKIEMVSSEDYSLSDHSKGIMPRGELNDHVLLCGGRPTLTGTIHGLGLRKTIPPFGWAEIVITPDAASSFTCEEDGGNPVLTVSASVREARRFKVDREIVNITTSITELQQFEDSDEVKDPISLLLIQALRHTLHKYHGFCMVSIPGVTKEHPAFVFASSLGKLTALTTTSKSNQSPGIIYISYLQSGLRGRTFWRPTCFVPQSGEKPFIVPWGKPIDVAEVQAVVKSAVLTFNAFNCDHELYDDDGNAVTATVFSDAECPYSLG